MRSKLAVALAVVLVGALLVPAVAPAKHALSLGSLKVTKADGTPLTSEVTGLAVILNPGLEKTMAQQLPPFMIPIFVDTDGPGSPNLDTFLALTNTLDVPISVKVTIYDLEGIQVGTPQTIALPARGTRSLLVSSLLP